MSVLIVGSVALDTVHTPFGSAEKLLGGSATFASLAARVFTTPSIVAVVGEDFPSEYLTLLQKKGIDTKGIKKEQGQTFSWEGEYDFQLAHPATKRTELGVFASFQPSGLEDYDPEIVFLANIDPVLQLSVLEQTRAKLPLVAVDTMNYWIEHKFDELAEVIQRVDIVFINEEELRQYTGQYNLRYAAQEILAKGPKFVVVKQGGYGSLLFSEDQLFNLPSFLVEEVRDPTGAGDSFAGAFLGYIAQWFMTLDHYEERPSWRDFLTEDVVKTALVQGTLVASFTVEDFGTTALAGLTNDMLDARYKGFLERLYTVTQ